jgi:serralysin
VAGSLGVTASNVERWMFQLGDANDTVLGSVGADVVSGSGGADTIDGLAGNDTLFGGAGLDTIRGGDGNDSLGGGAANSFGASASAQFDPVLGIFVALQYLPSSSVSYNDGFADIIDGGAGNDSVYGSAGVTAVSLDAGDDTIVGGDGFDWMAGDAGADVFRYTDVTHSRASSGTDAISDLVRGADRIDLAGIDANTTLAGDQAFTIGALQAGQAGRLQITLDPGVTPAWALIQGDVDGDGVADFDLLVFGNVAGLTGTDFVL